MRIWKFEMVITDRQTLSIPAGAKLLDAQAQWGVPCLWALCDETQPVELRHIAIYGTGNTMPDDPGKYIGTFQLNGGDLVFHVFEVIA